MHTDAHILVMDAALFFLRIILIIIIGISMIESTAINTDDDAMRLILDGDDVSGSHVDICCSLVSY